MTQGFKATLFAGVITLGVVAPVFAAAPVITDIPDVTIGDLESAVANTFEYDAPFSLNDYVVYDGNKSELLWSFGESDLDGLATQQYTINGVGSAVSGDTALADEAATPNLTVNPASPIPTAGTTTLFRDIVLSNGAGPHPDPTDPATAAAGKVITYYVSDGTSVDSSQSIVRSVDGANDSLTASEGWVERVDETDFISSNWKSSGVASPGVTNGKLDGTLNITLTPVTGQGRVLGWQNAELLQYDDVGPNRFVRGKFYISTTNFVLAPTNQVPGFRLRVSNEGSINAAAHFEYAMTNLASPPHEPRYAAAANPDAETNAGWLIRPGDKPNTPSLYRVNLDTIDVPSAAGSQIGALFESYAFSDSANGTLTLHEVILGTYDALADDAGELIFDYNRNNGLAAGIGGPKAMTGGGFRMEANFENGRRRTLFLSQYGDPGPYPVNTNAGADGLVASTENIPTDIFGINLLNVVSVDNEDKVRIEPGKLYKAKYYATSDLPVISESSPVQSNVAFRFQTAGTALGYYTEVISTAGPALSEDGVADDIANEAMPSATSQNPDTDESLDFEGEDGGWYTVVASSPLSSDGIRQDYEDDDFMGGGGFYMLGAQPGPGSASPSYKDVVLGIDQVQVPVNMTVTVNGNPTLINDFAQPNHGKVRIGAVQVYEYPEIDDGGYDFDGNPQNL